MRFIRALKSKIERALVALEGIASSNSEQKAQLTQLMSILEEAQLKREIDAKAASLDAANSAALIAGAISNLAASETQSGKDAMLANAARELAATRESIRNGTQRLSIAFFMQNTAVWPSWKTFWEACVNDPRIEPVMVLTPACLPDRELAWLDETRAFLMREGIGFIAAEAFTPERFRPHVAVLQLPYTDTLPEHLQLQRLHAANIRTVYIPYGLETGGGGLNYRYQFDLPAQRTAWRIFARSENQKRMYAKYCRSGSGHVVVTGHPKLDLSVLGYDSATADDALIKQIAGRKTVFWNPHFAVQDPPTWSTFDLFKDDILEAFAKRPDLFFIIRPHPLLFTGLIRNGFWTARDEEAFRARIAELENCTLDEWPDYQMAFALSDAIVTDVGSFLLEFYSTGKPVLMLQNPEGLGVNDDANTMEGLYKATRIDQIEAFLDLMMANEDPKEAERKKAIPRFFYHLDGHAGERIRDHIYDAFMRESVGSPIDAAPELQERPASYHHQLSSMQLEEASAKLNSLLDKIGAVSSALHIGCVDGRLTGIISKHARLVYGIDADPDMIAQARVNAASWGAGGKASFSVEHLDCIHSCGVYGLIVCIDVLSSVQNSYSLLRYIDALIAMMREGAHLIVGDRLAQGQAHKQTVDGRTIFYRNEQQYLMMFKRRGLVLEETIMNGQTDGCSYYMFRKVA